MKLTEKLDFLMKERGINKMDLSKYSGIPYTTIINFYEKGTENVKLSTLRKLAKYFNVSLDYLADDKIPFNDENIVLYGQMVNVPIVGRISCGNGSYAYEEIEGYELTPETWVKGGEYFYLRVKGDSMINARIYDGDLALIKKQNIVEDGEIAAVVVNDEAYLKRVYFHNDTLVLQSENPKYPPIICRPEDNCHIVGKLKKIIINI
jgi:repressor LexA